MNETIKGTDDSQNGIEISTINEKTCCPINVNQMKVQSNLLFFFLEMSCFILMNEVSVEMICLLFIFYEK